MCHGTQKSQNSCDARKKSTGVNENHESQSGCYKKKDSGRRKVRGEKTRTHSRRTSVTSS